MNNPAESTQVPVTEAEDAASDAIVPTAPLPVEAPVASVTHTRSEGNDVTHDETASEKHISLGAQLAKQRQALGYNAEFVANYLKLSVRKIHQIEAGDWAAFPSGPFVAGFVRNYARLVGLDSAVLVALLPKEMDRDAARAREMVACPVFREPRQEILQSEPDRLWLYAVALGVALLTVLLLTLFVLPKDAAQRLRMWGSGLSHADLVVQPAILTPTPMVSETPSQIAEAPSLSVDPQTPQSVLAGSVVPATSPAATTVPTTHTLPLSAVTSSAPVAASLAPLVPPTNVALTKIKIKFLGESWVEIKQKDGTVLLSQKNQKDSEKKLSGTPPFDVVIGNATQVELQYKGKVIDLQPFFSSEGVARLTLQ